MKQQSEGLQKIRTSEVKNNRRLLGDQKTKKNLKEVRGVVRQRGGGRTAMLPKACLQCSSVSTLKEKKGGSNIRKKL